MKTEGPRGVSFLVWHDRPAEELLTFEEYLELEERSTIKHEFVGGHRYAMAGALEAHNKIVANCQYALERRLRGGPCDVYTSDMKVRIAAADASYYPDLHVECGEERRPNALFHERPVVIVEVLSESTVRIDRGTKFEDYRLLETLRAYVLIDSRRRHVEVRRRTGVDDFESSKVSGESFDVPGLDIVLDVAELYERSGL